MLKQKIHILDNLFSHAKSTSLDNIPSYFEWDHTPNSEMTIFSDSHVFSVDSVDASKKIAWFIESPVLTKNSYDFVKLNSNKFNKIFTFDKEILDSINHSELVPIGGCWIPIGERKIHQKTKKVSIISSQKNFLPGHRLRHEVISRIPNLDVFGRGYNEIPNKIFGLKEYEFSISIENDKKDYYFTEKLIDCFITGTIPIYWGCPSIGNFFDSGGIITFDSLEQLDGIINNLDGEYEKRIESVKRNFDLCKKYLVADDIIYEKIKK
jgi:hypothetical protein